MTTQNDITGDSIKSKFPSNKYRDNWERIFMQDMNAVEWSSDLYITVNGEPGITITQKEYDELKEKEKWLDCLEAAGVDNWEGIEFAQEMMEEEDSNG